VVLPGQFNQIAEYEQVFGKTIDRDGLRVLVKASLGTAYHGCGNAALLAEAKDENWNGPIILSDGEWQLLAGAFGESDVRPRC
jgi:hypothetical protein